MHLLAVAQLARRRRASPGSARSSPRARPGQWRRRRSWGLPHLAAPREDADARRASRRRPRFAASPHFASRASSRDQGVATQDAIPVRTRPAIRYGRQVSAARSVSRATGACKAERVSDSMHRSPIRLENSTRRSRRRSVGAAKDARDVRQLHGAGLRLQPGRAGGRHRSTCRARPRSGDDAARRGRRHGRADARGVRRRSTRVLGEFGAEPSDVVDETLFVTDVMAAATCAQARSGARSTATAFAGREHTDRRAALGVARSHDRDQVRRRTCDGAMSTATRCSCSSIATRSTTS